MHQKVRCFILFIYFQHLVTITSEILKYMQALGTIGFNSLLFREVPFQTGTSWGTPSYGVLIWKLGLSSRANIASSSAAIWASQLKWCPRKTVPHSWWGSLSGKLWQIWQPDLTASLNISLQQKLLGGWWLSYSGKISRWDQHGSISCPPQA